MGDTHSLNENTARPCSPQNATLSDTSSTATRYLPKPIPLRSTGCITGAGAERLTLSRLLPQVIRFRIDIFFDPVDLTESWDVVDVEILEIVLMTGLLGGSVALDSLIPVAIEPQCGVAA